MRDQTFSDTFLRDTIDVVAAIDRNDIEACARVMRATRDAGGRLFFCGSGGGAGHASHATADFRKLGGFEAYCVTDNVSELTARTNDEGWDTSYSAWLTGSRIRSGDCLFVFSVGGGSLEPPVSVNLVRAIETARSAGANIVGVAGRDGGYLRQVATASILIPVRDASLTTPQAEGLQAVMWHLLISHPSLAASIAKWEGLEVRAS